MSGNGKQWFCRNEPTQKNKKLKLRKVLYSEIFLKKKLFKIFSFSAKIWYYYYYTVETFCTF